MDSGKRNILKVSLWLAMAWPCFPLASHCHAATLQRIDVLPAAESTGVIISLDAKARYQYSALPQSDTAPARCYIDLYNTGRDRAVPSWLQVDGRHVSKIRTGIYSTKLRIVLDLQQDFACAVTSSAAEPFQIKISVADPHGLAAGQTAPEHAETTRTALPTQVVASSAPEATRRAESSASVAPTMTNPLPGEDAQPPAVASQTASDASAWGWLQAFSALDTRRDRAEDHHLHRLRGRLGVDWESSLSVDHALKLRAAVDLDRFFYDADQADDKTEVRLHETYVQIDGADWDMSFGKQRVRWGKSDQLSPVDSINPQDFRQFITIDLEERALPSWLLRNRWHGAAFGLETIVQPWFMESKIEYFDSDWAIYRNLRQAIIDNPQAPAALKDYVRKIRVTENQPGSKIDNLSAAARATWRTEQADFALSYHYGWETLPTITSFPVKNITYSGDAGADLSGLLNGAVFTNERVQAEYKRQQTVGFEWETVLDPLGFRGEIAHINHVAFLGDDFTSQRKPVTHLVSGIDYTSANDWYFNLQGSWYHIHDYSDHLLYFEADTLSVLGEIRKSVWRGNLELATQYNCTLTDRSSYLKPSATLKYFRNLELEVGLMIFSGSDNTLLGSYDQADQVYGLLKYSF